MLGLAPLEKHLELGRFNAVIESCLDPSGLLPIETRLMVESDEHAACAATALALTRSIELTRRITPQAERIAADLLLHQRDDGLFESGGSPVSTVLSVAALGSFVQTLERTVHEQSRNASIESLLRMSREAIRCGVERLRSQAAISPEGLVHDSLATSFLLVMTSKVPGLLDPRFVSALIDALHSAGAMHDRRTARVLRHAVAISDVASRRETTPAAA